jgi:hypothetical protein
MSRTVRHAPDLDRIRANTSPEVNERLDRQTEQRLQNQAGQDREALDRRASELEREWDFERLLEAEASTMGLMGLILSVTVDRRFLIIPGVVASMVLLHALHGWYPLLPLFRRIGVRSQDEIAREFYAVKALRGDFGAVTEADGDHVRRAHTVWRAVCA